MGYAIYHVEKGKSSSGGISNHIDRKQGTEIHLNMLTQIKNILINPALVCKGERFAKYTEYVVGKDDENIRNYIDAEKNKR